MTLKEATESLVIRNLEVETLYAIAQELMETEEHRTHPSMFVHKFIKEIMKLGEAE